MRRELVSLLLADHAACAAVIGRRTIEALHGAQSMEKVQSVVPGFASLLVAAYPYKCSLPSPKGVSMYAAALDYHSVLPSLMEKTAQYLTDRGYRAHIMTDVSPLNERACALAAGLGILGDNGLLIVPEYGSYVFIGTILTDAPLVPDDEDVPQEIKSCEHCGACRRLCPYGALSGDGFNTDLCISELSQRRRLSDRELEMLRSTSCVWGCDRCQQACPHNAQAKETDIPGFLSPRLTDDDIAAMEDISNSAFKKKYGAYALSWRGAAVLRRNIKNLK